jgi:hypothetical protein
MDELPAFNITISCANEYGHNAKLALYGVTIVNEGQVMSINDVYTENTYQFFATNVEYLDRVEKTSKTSGKKTATTNLPVKSQTQGIGSGTSVSTPVTSVGNADSTSSGETASSIEDEITKRMKQYDSLKSQKLDELESAVNDYINGTIDPDTGKPLYTTDSIAKYVSDWERSENSRCVALYKEKIMTPLIEELESNHEKGEISDENYQLQRKIIMGAGSLLQTSVIVKSNMVEGNYQRERASSATGTNVPDVTPSAEETINEFKKDKDIQVVDLSKTPDINEDGTRDVELI